MSAISISLLYTNLAMKGRSSHSNSIQYSTVIMTNLTIYSSHYTILFYPLGHRSAALTLGWMRALRELQLWDHAKYLSANSGSSLVAVPITLAAFSYPLSLDQILGMSPRSMDSFFAPSGLIQEALTDAKILDMYNYKVDMV
jgi:hypothetical protein